MPSWIDLLLPLFCFACVYFIISLFNNLSISNKILCITLSKNLASVHPSVSFSFKSVYSMTLSKEVTLAWMGDGHVTIDDGDAIVNITP